MYPGYPLPLLGRHTEIYIYELDRFITCCGFVPYLGVKVYFPLIIRRDLRDLVEGCAVFLYTIWCTAVCRMPGASCLALASYERSIIFPSLSNASRWANNSLM